MKFDDSFIVPGIAAAEAFDMLTDLATVVQCLPGAELLDDEPGDDGWYRGRIHVSFGPTRFDFQGTVRLADVNTEMNSAKLVGEGSDVSGSGQAHVALTASVTPSSDGSEVALSTDLTVTGPPARLGDAFIAEAAGELLDEFAMRFSRMAGGTGPVEDGQLSTTAPAGRSLPKGQASSRQGSSAPAEPAPLPGLRLIGRVLLRRFRKWAAARRARWSRGQYGPQSAPELDLAVVGTGSGALVAAILAHEAGLRVAIFEKAPVVGGGTAYSGGVVWAPNNHIMQRKSMDDSVDDALTYLRHASGGRGDERLQRAYVENVANILEHVEQLTGVAWVIWPGQPDYYPGLPGARHAGRAVLPHPNSAAEVLEPAEKVMPDLALVRSTPHMDFVPGFQQGDRPARDSWLAGRSIIGSLWKVVLERGIEFHVSSPVVSLNQEDGDVTEIVVAPVGAPRRTIRTGAVLLNTGGMDWNSDLLSRYLPDPAPHPQTPPSNTGDGHLMAMQIGAGTALLDKAILHPSIQIPGDTHDEGQLLYRMFNMELAKPHCIVVNRAGRRFASEAAYFALADAWLEVNPITREVENLPSYFVCDDTYRTKYGFPGTESNDEVPDWVTSAATVPELAAELGVAVAGLEDQVTLYNRAAEDGRDPQFGRGDSLYEQYWGDQEHDGANPTMGPLEKAPFHAFELHLASAGTRGGVTIAPSGQVLRPDGSPIGGLYASGNVAANGLFGSGYASGSAVGSSLVFGYLAALDIVSANKAGGQA